MEFVNEEEKKGHFSMSLRFPFIKVGMRILSPYLMKNTIRDLKAFRRNTHKDNEWKLRTE